MPLIVLAGEEEFLIAEELQNLKDKLLDPAWASFNYSRLLDPTIKDLADAAASIPFGPGNKLIVMERCGLFTKKRGDKDPEEEVAKKSTKNLNKTYEDLEAALSAIHPNTYVVLACVANFDSSLKVSKIVEKYAEKRNFAKIKFYLGSPNKELLNWANRRAAKLAVEVEDEAVFYLAESSDCDLRQIAGELEKAAIFVLPQKKISLATISQLSPHQSNVFALLDNWAASDRESVLKNIQEVLARQSVIPTLAALQMTLGRWLDLKLKVESIQASLPAAQGAKRELSTSDLAGRIAQHPAERFVVELNLKKIRHLSLEKLVKTKQELNRLEPLVKTGQMRGDHAISVLFTN